MKKAMISQPMNGFTDKQIKTIRDRAIKRLKTMGYEVVDTFFTKDNPNSGWVTTVEYSSLNTPIYYLSKSIEAMAGCDAVYFCKGWREARGCKIEHEIASEYGLEVLEEDDSEDVSSAIAQLFQSAV